MRVLTAAATSALILLLSSAPLDAQEATSRARCPSMRAELGIGWTSSWEEAEDEGWNETITVQEVYQETAAAGSLEAGDRIARVNGLMATSQLFWSLRRTLRPGDQVRLLVLREGREREVVLEAREPVEREDGRCSGRCEEEDADAER